MAEQVKDPVCGMKIDRTRTALQGEHKGKTFVRCSAAPVTAKCTGRS